MNNDGNAGCFAIIGMAFVGFVLFKLLMRFALFVWIASLFSCS